RAPRGEPERGRAALHPPGARGHLDGGEARGPREDRERVPGEWRVREDVAPPEVEEALRHRGDLVSRMGLRTVNVRPTGFCAPGPSAPGEAHPEIELRGPRGHRDPRPARRGPGAEIPGIRDPRDDPNRGAP